MKSYEVLRETVEGVGAKQVAFDLRISHSLVYKWCADPVDHGVIEPSGARNPLDRVLHICESSRSVLPAEWLCSQLGGYYVEGPDTEPEALDAEFLHQTQALVNRFSKLLGVVSSAISNEGRIDPAEADEIRSEWRQLQSRGEAFVRGCEAGLFDPERSSGT
jgi:hypothetical protein